MKPQYWLIKWNAKRKGGKRSSRMFSTFLSRPELFETYGYKKADEKLFEKVEEGDQVFCYQKDEKKIVGLCEVKAKETIDQNGVGGRCLVLRAKINFSPGSNWAKQVRNIVELSEDETGRIFKECGLKWPIETSTIS